MLEEIREEDRQIQGMARSHLDALLGETLDYFGCDAGDNTFKLDGVIFKAVEDENDGYRSMLGAIDYSDQHSSIFFRTPIARVRITIYDSGEEVEPDLPRIVTDDDGDDYYSVDRGYRLVDVDDGHVWLVFGTNNYDDYYPYFVFRHFPKGHRV
jgi:hypothetical protein